MQALKKTTASLAIILSWIFGYAQETALKEGDIAPDFKLLSDAGQWIKLSDFKGKNVVLYFYPKDQTSGCTKEACNMRDNLPRITAENTVVLGVSVDNVTSHKAFKEKEKLNFILLADTAKAVSKQYSGLNPLGWAKRVTFIIDKKGVIKKIFWTVDVNKHHEEILTVLKEMK
jgi:thioredoxin-dependent peroxiredoxin